MVVTWQSMWSRDNESDHVAIEVVTFGASVAKVAAIQTIVQMNAVPRPIRPFLSAKPIKSSSNARDMSRNA